MACRFCHCLVPGSGSQQFCGIPQALAIGHFDFGWWSHLEMVLFSVVFYREEFPDLQSMEFFIVYFPSDLNSLLVSCGLKFFFITALPPDIFCCQDCIGFVETASVVSLGLPTIHCFDCHSTSVSVEPPHLTPSIYLWFVFISSQTVKKKKANVI